MVDNSGGSKGWAAELRLPPLFIPKDTVEKAQKPLLVDF